MFTINAGYKCVFPAFLYSYSRHDMSLGLVIKGADDLAVKFSAADTVPGKRAGILL